MRKIVKTKLNLEMAVSMEMLKIALKYKPDTCTLVPESPDEITTSGGLDILMYRDKVEEIAGNLNAAGLMVSVFIDPEIEQIKSTHRMGIKMIEINTGEYAKNWNTNYSLIELEKIKKSAQYAKKLNMKVYGGHGLTYRNVKEIAAIPEIEELNIGHSIIANSTFLGLEEAVKRMLKLTK